MSSSRAAGGTATNASTTSREFLDELYELLERDKDNKNTTILELILQQWQEIGDDRKLASSPSSPFPSVANMNRNGPRCCRRDLEARYFPSRRTGVYPQSIVPGHHTRIDHLVIMEPWCFLTVNVCIINIKA